MTNRSRKGKRRESMSVYSVFPCAPTLCIDVLVQAVNLHFIIKTNCTLSCTHPAPSNHCSDLTVGNAFPCLIRILRMLYSLKREYGLWHHMYSQGPMCLWRSQFSEPISEVSFPQLHGAYCINKFLPSPEGPPQSIAHHQKEFDPKQFLKCQLGFSQWKC